MNKMTLSNNPTKLQWADPNLYIYLKHSIHDFPPIGGYLYGNIILNKEINTINKREHLRVITNSKFNDPFIYEFINDDNGLLIEKIIMDAEDISQSSWRACEKKDRIWRCER